MFLAQGFIDPATLEQLVKLAALGTSGICILSLFIIGYLIYTIPNEHHERHRTVRMYMWICVIIAIISAGSGFANAYFNLEKVEKASMDKQAALNKVSQIQSEATTQAAKFEKTESELRNKLLQQSLALTQEQQKNKQLADKFVTLDKKLGELSEGRAPSSTQLKDILNLSTAIKKEIKPPQ